MRASRLALVAFLLCAAPAVAAAQEERGCDILRIVEMNVVRTSAGNEVIFMSGPVEFRCDGGITIRGDSAVKSPSSFELIGNAFYEDSIRTLTSDWLNYFGADERLFARGNVELRDRETNSVITGPELQHERETETRTQSRTVVQGRPHAVLHPRRSDDTARPDSTAVPFEIDSDWMEILGQHSFRASGRVDLERGETRGFGNFAQYDQDTERLTLNGAARIEGDAYQLTAEQIEGRLEAERIRELVARTNAELTSDDLTVDASELRLYFDAGQLQRLVAREPADAGAGPDPRATNAQVRATARELILVADSLDVLAPAQQLETVIAVGNAFAERLVDSLDVDLPDVISKDWLRGDTITGHFVPADSARAAGPARIEPGAEPDSAGARAVLERIVAAGLDGRASSLYRLRERTDPEVRPSISYTVADRITLVFRNGDVAEAAADGQIWGMHLQPATQPAPPDTGSGTATAGGRRPASR